MNGYVLLDAASLLDRFELWRLITYPVGIQFGAILIGSIVFSQPGEEIEAMLGTRSFGIILLVVTVLVGLLHILVFASNPTAALYGPTTISLFVMTGYVYLYPESSVRIIFFSLRSIILLGLIAAISLFSVAFMISDGASALNLITWSLSGLIAGLLYFHFRYQKYQVLLEPIRRIRGMFGRGEESPQSLHVIRGTKMTRQIPDEPDEEEEMNRLLDKISKEGYDSLTKKERKFLDDFSSRM